MLTAFLSLFPIILLVAGGVAIGRMVLKPKAELSNHYILIDHFVHYVVAPLFFLFALARTNPNTIIDLPYFLALLASQFIMLGVALVITGNFFHEPFGERMLHSLSAAIPASLYLGVPILSLIFGEQGILPAIQAVLIQYILMRPLFVGALEFDLAVRRGFSHGTWQLILKKMVKAWVGLLAQPLLWASLLGTTIAFMGWDIPRLFYNFSNMAGAGLPGVCLFALGVFMGQSKFSYQWSLIQESCWVVILKLIFMPLLTWFVVTLFFPYLESVRSAAVVVTSALPTASMVMLLSNRFGIRRKRTMLEFHLTALASAITLTVILTYYLN